MRLRSPPRDASDARAAGSTDADSSGSARTGTGRGARTVRNLILLALGLVAVAYAARRYVGLPEAVPSREDVEELQERVPSTDELREQTTDAMPDEFQEIPIGERGAGDESAAEESTGTDVPDDVTEAVDDAETNVDMTAGERSPEEISERADETVPEPGEMAVDEEVAEELVDEDEVADASEEGSESEGGTDDEG